MRQTAVRVTETAAIAEREGITNTAAVALRHAARRDAAAASGLPSTAALLSQFREDRLGGTQKERAQVFTRRAQDAAGLSLTGKMYSPEDRRDCAADLVEWTWASMPEGAGWPGVNDSRFTLTVYRGRAQNWRRALDTRRTLAERAGKDRQARRAATWDHAVSAATASLHDVAIAAQTASDAATDAADLGADRLGVPRGGAVWSVLYQWARDEDGATCARELGVREDTWRSRTRTAGAAIKLLAIDLSTFLDTLFANVSTGTAADGTPIYSLADERVSAYRSPGKITPPAREGTNGGARPEPVESADAAREICAVTHMCPTPDLRAIGRRMTRRGYWRSAVVTADGRRMYWKTTPRSDLQVQADARRAIGQALRRPGARERGVKGPDSTAKRASANQPWAPRAARQR